MKNTIWDSIECWEEDDDTGVFLWEEKDIKAFLKKLKKWVSEDEMPKISDYKTTFEYKWQEILIYFTLKNDNPMGYTYLLEDIYAYNNMDWTNIIINKSLLKIALREIIDQEVLPCADMITIVEEEYNCSEAEMTEIDKKIKAKEMDKKNDFLYKLYVIKIDEIKDSVVDVLS